MKIVLFGGSNSVRMFSFAAGLTDNKDVTLTNLSLGATSSLQNLDACIAHHKVVMDADLIITESNINDSFNIGIDVVPIDHVLENIDKFYEILSKANKKVLSLILPINFNHNPPESIEVFSRVNQRHLLNIERYGFDYIDLNTVFTDFIEANEFPTYLHQMDRLMPDQRHPKTLLMYDIASNIVSYYLKSADGIIDRLSDNESSNDFVSLKASDLGVETVEIQNSAFAVRAVVMNKKVSLPIEYEGYKIIGISTWGEGRLKICTGEKTVVKQFNQLYAFNEIIDEIFVDAETYIVNTLDEPTESSINAKKITSPGSFTNLVGVLLEKGDYSTVSEAKKNRQKTNLDILVPDLIKYINDTSSFVEASTETNTGLSPTEINLIRDSAVRLEKINLNLAHDLMLLAHKGRPNGAGIKKKLEKYRSLLASGKEL